MIPDLVLYWLAFIFSLLYTFSVPAGKINWLGAAAACMILSLLF